MKNKFDKGHKMIFENSYLFITNEQKQIIQNLVKKYSYRYVIPQIKIDNLEIMFNKRLKIVSGKFKWYNYGNKTKIELNVKHLDIYGFESIIKVFLHEFAHFIHYCLTGYTNHNRMFKEICKDIGGVMNKAIAGNEFKECATEEFLQRNYRWHYKCCCGYVDFKTVRKLKRLDSYCPKCNNRMMHCENKLF